MVVPFGPDIYNVEILNYFVIHLRHELGKARPVKLVQPVQLQLLCEAFFPLVYLVNKNAMCKMSCGCIFCSFCFFFGYFVAGL